MKDLKTVSILSFFADEFLNSADLFSDGLTANKLSDAKTVLMWHMVKALKAEIGFLGIKPPNKITVTPEDARERIEQLVEFEKANEFSHMNDRAQKDFRKAINGTYKSWIK
jgi:hypothetical protein